MRLDHSASLSCCDVHYAVSGSGPALVCLHASSGVRMTAATELLLHAFTVYQPACPGFDGTPPSAGMPSVPQLADWMGEFIDTVIAAPVHVSGHSFGGWVASWLAARRPDLVRALVLQCPIGAGPLHPVPATAKAEDLLARRYARPERRPAETKSEATIASNRKMAAAYGNGVVQDDVLLDRLSHTPTPTMILHGREDGIVPLEGMRLLARALPNAGLVRVQEAAHNIEVDQPETYAQLVQQFLERHA